jgi:hypothetical protein
MDPQVVTTVPEVVLNQEFGKSSRKRMGLPERDLRIRETVCREM